MRGLLKAEGRRRKGSSRSAGAASDMSSQVICTITSDTVRAAGGRIPQAESLLRPSRRTHHSSLVTHHPRMERSALQFAHNKGEGHDQWCSAYNFADRRLA